MASLFKKLTVVLLVPVAALCLAMGILFTPGNTTAFAAEEIVTLDKVEDFNIASNELTGLSATGSGKITGDKNYKIVIPGSVTSIAANAFNSGKENTLKEITIPAGVTSIGKNAFANRTGLEVINYNATACANFSATPAENPFYRAGGSSGKTVTVNIGEDGGAPVTKIPANMFLNDRSGSNTNNISTVNFVNVDIKVGTFGAYAFQNCYLKTVNFTGGTLNEIGNGAFDGCDRLESVVLPADVTRVCDSAFRNCTSLKSVTLSDNLVTIDNYAFYGCEKLGNVTIPENVTKIGQYAFNNCSSFSVITVPAGVTEIGVGAFSGCTSAKTINYYAENATDTPQRNSPFAKGANGATVNIGGSTPVKNLPAYLFYSTNDNPVRIGEVNFANVELTVLSSFGQSVFTNCSALSKVSFEAGCIINKIGMDAFQNCTSLNSITVKSSGGTEISGLPEVKTIEAGAFQNCTSLSNIVLPSSLTGIGTEAFNGCSALYTITIPSKVSSIGDDAFTGCNKLVEVNDESDELTITKGAATNGNVAAYALNVYSGSGSKLSETSDGNYVFYVDGSNNHLISYIGSASSITLPTDCGDGKSYTIYDRAFKDNKNIRSIDAKNAKITAIGESAFESCINLSKISIPASVTEIDMNAFHNCTSLSEVTFAENSTLTSILGSAFDGCGRLSVIKLPSSVTQIRSNAFANCSSLKTVYLPNNNTVTIDSTAFPNSGILLIADAQYYEILKGKLPVNSNKLTYKVAINLVYDSCISDGKNHTKADGDNNEPHTAYRLYNCDYNLVEQADGSWQDVENGMPVQHGYSSSVWYQDADYNTQATGTWLTGELAKSREVGSAITIYAKTVKYPTLVSKEAVYNADQGSDLANLIQTDKVDQDVYSITVTGYKTYYTREAKPVPLKLVAGYYTLTVTLKGTGNGAWAAPYTTEIVVSPAEVNVEAESGKFQWVQLKGTEGSYTSIPLSDVEQTLYIHQDGSKTTPYFTRQSDKDDTVTVKSSYLSFMGNEVTLAIVGNSEYYTVSSGYSGDYKATESGIYTASVQITATNNYRFTTGTFEKFGLKLELVSGNTYTVTKTWYIVVDKSNKPKLGNSDYSIPCLLGGNNEESGWIYNSENAPSVDDLMPTLTYGTAADLITFSLYRHENTAINDPVISGMIAANVKYENFGYYINKSMPAGDYRLELVVKDCEVEGVKYGGNTYNYDFTVAYASTNGGFKGQLDKYSGEKNPQSHVYDGEVYFGDVSSIEVLQLTNLHPQRSGYWATVSDTMYGDFKVSYDIVKGQPNDNNYTYADASGIYYTQNVYEANYNKATQSIPCELGMYRVYYNVTAPSYVGLVDNNSNSKPYFYVRIYGIVTKENLPYISSPAYTGKQIQPLVTDDKDWFKWYYLDKSFSSADLTVISAAEAKGYKEEYINAGVHYMALSFKGVYANYQLLDWSKSEITDTVQVGSEYFAIIPFNIPKAQNISQQLTFKTWNWGQFDEKDNCPNWNTRYATEGAVFTLNDRSTDKVLYTYGDTEGKGFQDADAGTYTLKAYVPASDNWTECSDEMIVTILRGNITWDTTPYITSWKYGDYKEAPLTEGELSSAYAHLISKVKTCYCLASDVDDHSKHYASLSGLAVDGEIPAGNYALVYELTTDDANYNSWVSPVYFSVLKADNYWDISPTVAGWYFGDSAIDYENYKPNFKPHMGNKDTVKIEYCMLDDDYNEIGAYKSTLAGLIPDRSLHLPVGHYKLKATMPGTANFASMEFTMNFTVAKAQNSWKDTPSVVSWQESRWTAEKNSFIAADLYGSTVYVEIRDADENVIVEKQRLDQLNVNTLKALGVGAYKFIAYVNESYDHEGLESVAYFAVLEDSVGLTGLIAATVVFAVIAIGLAAVATVFLIRRNKKIEQEFRSMIKSELNRR